MGDRGGEMLIGKALSMIAPNLAARILSPQCNPPGARFTTTGSRSPAYRPRLAPRRNITPSELNGMTGDGGFEIWVPVQG